MQVLRYSANVESYFRCCHRSCYQSPPLLVCRTTEQLICYCTPHSPLTGHCTHWGNVSKTGGNILLKSLVWSPESTLKVPLFKVRLDSVTLYFNQMVSICRFHVMWTVVMAISYLCLTHEPKCVTVYVLRTKYQLILTFKMSLLYTYRIKPASN